MNEPKWHGTFTQETAYRPQNHPGFTAWATAFSYGECGFGLCFDEATAALNPDYLEPRLEFGEAAGVPVSYCSIEVGDKNHKTERVYLRSDDGLRFTETGRCPRKNGSLCCVGFKDGRILGFDVPKYHPEQTGWAQGIRVSESTDGGSAWRTVKTLLEGTAPYLWRVRQLNSGTILLLASLYGTPWGENQARPTRNTMLKDETYTSKIISFFMTSADGGKTFSEPHYVLPGIGAHEFDAAELPDGRLVLIAGDVQGTPSGRQMVTPSKDGWINGPLLPIRNGAPDDPMANPQGGYIPETIVYDRAQRLLVGYRRNKCFSVSNDLGENWTAINPSEPFSHLYQPYLLPLRQGKMGLYGHIGGDNAFGENDMRIVAQVFSLDIANILPKAAVLSFKRLLSEDGTQYINAFRATLTADGKPLANQTLCFRFSAYWRADGSVNTAPLADAPDQVLVITDEKGEAVARAERFDGVADIHLAYNADAVCLSSPSVMGCTGPMMTVLALTPKRRTPYPYDAYFAGGTLYLSPAFLSDFPGAVDALQASLGDAPLKSGALPAAAVDRLLSAGVLTRKNGEYRFINSVHAPRVLHNVREMTSADWYV